MIYLARHPLLRLAGNWWVVSDPLAARRRHHRDWRRQLLPATAPAHAADLFRAGWAPVVVASGRMLRPYAGVAELIAHDLQS